MKNLFEGVVEYLDFGAEKSTKVIYMVNAMTYTEAEVNLTEYMMEYNGVNDFLINKLSRVCYDDYVYKQEQEDYDWFESSVSMRLDESDKVIKFKYLVADDSIKSATSQLISFLENSDGDTKILYIKERSIGDIIVRKECCETCDKCDRNVRILSFDQQKIEGVTFGDMKDKDEADMRELGAISISMSRYKIKVSKESLKKSVGKYVAERVIKKWKEVFIDEDTGEAVEIERSEIFVDSGCEIDDYVIDRIIESEVSEITLKR